MKAVAIERFGGPEGLAVVDLPDPRPTQGQVLIATEAIGVGFQDAMIRSGALAAYGFKEGYVLGGEIAGRVLSVGEGVDPAWTGRRIWTFVSPGGGYATHAVAQVEALVPVPDALSMSDAVALGSSGVVAHFGLQHARLTPSESVLIRGAAGPIGLLAVQLAVRGGAATVAVTTSSPDRGERLRQLGATHVLDRAGTGNADAPSGYDVILDIAAGPDLASFFTKLNPNGRMVSVGAVAGFPPPDFAQGMFAAFQKSLSFATFSANTVAEPERRTMTAELFELAVRGELRTVLEEVLPLEQAMLAHRKMERGGGFGKLILTPSQQEYLPVVLP